MYVCNIKNSPGVWGTTLKEPLWTFDINDVAQNNCYVHLFSTAMRDSITAT